MKMVSSPRVCLSSPATGIDPPDLIMAGAMPQPCSIARRAARSGSESIAQVAGAPPPWSWSSQRHPAGVRAVSHAKNDSLIALESWSSTNRNDTLALALDGMTVLAPGPV